MRAPTAARLEELGHQQCRESRSIVLEPFPNVGTALGEKLECPIRLGGTDRGGGCACSAGGRVTRVGRGKKMQMRPSVHISYEREHHGRRNSWESTPATTDLALPVNETRRRLIVMVQRRLLQRRPRCGERAFPAQPSQRSQLRTPRVAASTSPRSRLVLQRAKISVRGRLPPGWIGYPSPHLNDVHLPGESSLRLQHRTVRLLRDREVSQSSLRSSTSVRRSRSNAETFVRAPRRGPRWKLPLSSGKVIIGSPRATTTTPLRRLRALPAHGRHGRTLRLPNTDQAHHSRVRGQVCPDSVTYRARGLRHKNPKDHARTARPRNVERRGWTRIGLRCARCTMSRSERGELRGDPLRSRGLVLLLRESALGDPITGSP
jgi:hypothetical protein